MNREGIEAEILALGGGLDDGMSFHDCICARKLSFGLLKAAACGQRTKTLMLNSRCRWRKPGRREEISAEMSSRSGSS